MSNKPKRRGFAAPSRVLRNTLLTWAAGLILIAMPATRVSSLGEVLLLMPFVIALSITAHELGHLFAARIGGLRPVVLLLGNVWIRFVGPRPRVGMSSAFLVGGYVVVSPVREPSRFSLILFLLGGAIANASMLIAPLAVLIVLALLFQHSAQPILQIGAPIAVLFAIYNFWLLPIALIPRVFSGFMTDGGHVRAILRSASYRRVLVDLMRFGSQQFEGVRPRDWDRMLCDRLLESKTQYIDPVAILVLAHCMAVDSGDIERAEELLVEAEPLRETIKTVSIESLSCESAFFYGFYKSDPLLCQHYIDQCTLLDLSPDTKDRLEAALAYSKGEFDKAIRYGRLMLEGLRPPMSPGMDMYLRDSITSLTKECENKLNQVSVNSV